MASIQDRSKQGRGWVVHFRNPSGKQSTRSFRTENEAKVYAATVVTDKVRGVFVAPAGGREKFGARWDRFHDSSTNLRPSTRLRNETYARTHILPRFGAVRIGEITRDDVQEWVVALEAKGLAPATVRKLYQLLARVLEDAVLSRLIPSNPCQRVRLPKTEMVEQRFLTPVEVETLSAAIDERFRVWALTAAYTGLRAGELFGLRRSRLDLIAGRVTVVEQVSEVGGRIEFAPPKTAASRRTVPVPRFLCDELTIHTAGMGPDDLVFPAPMGGPVRLRLFRQRYWTPAIVAAGLDPLRVHDLRHTAVTLWIAAGASPKEIAARAGHRSVVTVLDRYGHLLPSTEDSVTDALDSMGRSAVRPRAVGEVVELRSRNG